MSQRPQPTWARRAKMHRVIDGDTVDMLVDLGWNMTQVVRFRLLGVDTPELRSSDAEERWLAQEATTWVELWFADAEELAEWPFTVLSYKSGKYGRWLAYIWRDGDERSLNRALLETGLGREI